MYAHYDPFSGYEEDTYLELHTNLYVLQFQLEQNHIREGPLGHLKSFK